jgi:hypothetical protein|tara:strand:+ start:91 stop:216 length:126 start_codon:yes stop_codon:yes gene_type:complete
LRANLKELVRVQDAILFLRRVKSVIEVKADEWTLPLLTTGA